VRVSSRKVVQNDHLAALVQQFGNYSAPYESRTSRYENSTELRHELVVSDRREKDYETTSNTSAIGDCASGRQGMPWKLHSADGRRIPSRYAGVESGQSSHAWRLCDSRSQFCSEENPNWVPPIRSHLEDPSVAFHLTSAKWNSEEKRTSYP
jgi:hypothetical protein